MYYRNLVLIIFQKILFQQDIEMIFIKINLFNAKL